MANNLIQVKRTSVSGRAANSTTLPNPGELALNMTDGILYSTNGSTVFEIGANNTNARVSGTLTAGNGVFSGNVSISGNLVVNGGIISLTGNVITFTDNMLYLNQGVLATITNITSNGTHVVFTANNNFSAGLDVFVSGVDPSSYNGNYVDITAANSTTFTVANTNTASYVSGGTARGKTDQNPDLGIAAGYNDGTYHHTGIFRDATDARWKVFDNYAPEPDASPYIDTANSTFHLADFQANTLYLGNTTANWLVANTSGVYHTGTVNATSFTGNLTGNVVATNVNAATIQVSTSITLDNDKNLQWKAKNTSTVVGMRQQSDDNFVFYSTDATYAARPVFAIYANSSTSNLQMLVPLNLASKLGANGSFGTSGQVLTTNGSGVYWSAAGSGSVDVNAQYAWTNTHTFSANVSFTGNGIGIASNTGAIYLGGIGDANWKIARNAGVSTKWKYTNNTIDIVTANSNLEGMTIGLVNGNSYFETGYLGTFIASNVTVGNSTSNISINSTAFVGNVVATSISGNLIGNVAAITISGNLTGNVTATTVSSSANVSVGNSTVNVYANTTAFVGNTVGVHTGNVAATTISGNLTGNVVATTISGNLTGNVVATTITGNLTGNVVATTITGNLTGNVSATTVAASANIAVGANVLITTANLAIGNSIANVFVNSTAFVGNTVGVHTGNVAATTISGNLTGNVVATTITGNLTGNVSATTISGNLTGNVVATTVNASANVYVGNSSVFVYANSTAFVGNVVSTAISGNLTGNVVATTISGNLTGNVVATTISGNLTGNVAATTITGNLTGNVVAGTVNATTINATSSIVVGANVSLNTSVLSIGNSTVNVFVNSTAFVGNIVATTITGNLTGNVVATNISGNLTGNVSATTLSGNLTAVTANVTNKLQIGAPGSFDFGSNAVIEIDANGNTYVQAVVQNANTGNNASADLVVTNDTGNDSFNYVDLGINGSNYNQPGFNITGQNDAYLYASHGNLAIGTAAAGKEIIFHAGGTTTSDRRLTVNSTAVIIANAAALVANGSTGTAGQILTSNSTGVYWSSSANNALNLGGVAAASYQLNSTLNANVAAYLPTYTGVVNASTFQVGTAFKANTTDVVTANLTVQGNLIVTGTTVTLNTATLDVKDLNITLAKGTASAAAANGAGITVDAAFAEIVYINSSNTWLSNINFGVGNSTSNVSINSTAFIGNVVATTVTGNLTGNVAATTISASANLTVGSLLVANSTVVNATHLAGVAGASYVQNTDSRTLSGNLVFAGSNTTVNAVFRVVNSSANLLFIGSDGNVGIGETSPLRKLTVRGDSAASLTVAAFYNADTTANNGSVFSFRSDTTGTGAATFQEFAAITGRYGNHDHATRSGGLDFYTVENGTGATRMSVVANGNVGIANVTPDATLAVTGTANISANVTIGGYLTLPAGTASIYLSNGTSNWISYASAGVAAPTVSSRSAGTKLLFYPGVNSTAVDYAVGIETGAIWHSVPTPSQMFKWYANSTSFMTANTTALYHTGAVNAASFTVGTAFTANSTVVNAVSYYAGTLLVANSTVINATHLAGKTEGNLNVNNATTVTSGVYTTDSVQLSRATTIGVADWNTLTTAGIYQVGTAAWTGSTNHPSAAYTYGQLHVSVNGNIVTQVYYTHATNGHFIRSKYNAADWQNWQEILTSLNYNEFAPTLTGTGASGTWNITANNSTYLGSTAAASYVQNTDSRTLSGNLVFSGSNTTINAVFRVVNSTANVLFAGSDGNIGIGTVSPQAVLDLGAATNGRAITWGSDGSGRYASIFTPYSSSGLVLAGGFHGNTTADAYVSSYTGTYYNNGIKINTFGAQGIQFFADASAAKTAGAAFVPTERMRITAAGDVGIGTTAPSSKLQVVTSSGAAPINSVGSGALRLRSSTSPAVGVGPSIIFEGKTNNTTTDYGFGAIQGFKSSTTADDYSGSLAFYTQTSGGATAFNERMRITNAGVIIGDGETSAAPVNALIEATDGSGTNIAGASFTIQGGRGTGTAAGGSIILSTSNASATSGTTLNAATERMRITSDGDVAIGGTTSTGYSASYTSLVVGSTSKIGLIKLRSAYNSGNGAEVFQLNTGTTYFTTNSAGTWMVSDASGNVGIGTISPSYKLQVNGAFAATTKSFVIDHPTKPDMKLRYGSLEGPENGVYFRGKSTSRIIELPDYWEGLVDEDSITVTLTAIGKKQRLYVKEIRDNAIVIGGSWKPNYFYTVYAERKDVEKLVVEF